MVEYPHTTRRHVLRAPEAIVKVLDVKVKPNLTVGYVMGVGDEMPQALEQIGARVELLGEDELAWGDLNRFDVVMTGVRAYERRADLRAYNQRLLDYARAGGTVIVNYNKFEFNEAQYGPFPARSGASASPTRTPPCACCSRSIPCSRRPTRSPTPTGRAGGRSADCISSTRRPRSADRRSAGVRGSVPLQRRARSAARWSRPRSDRAAGCTSGSGLWRQLPAGTDGAYRLMANLISLGSRPAATPTR